MDGASDAELVARITGGDTAAFAELYDRYADRIHDLCLHLLRNRHDAADATAEVFLAAADHLDQLRDPSRLRSWLYAIARNEVYRRTRSRSRETVVDAADFAEVPAVIDLREDEADPAAMVGLVREAALGLDERDRLVMEMTLAGGLDGRDLGDALGLGENAAHQAAHRMRERLGRSIGALLVARQGREECDDLEALLATWDGTFSVLWRKRVARHIDNCETCEGHRRRVPAAVLGGSAFAAPLPVRFIGPPDSVREQVLAGVATNGIGAAARHRKGWRADGFPPAAVEAERRRALLAIAAAVLLVIGAVAGIATMLGDDGDQEVSVAGVSVTAAERKDAGDATTRPVATAAASTSTSVVAAAPGSSTPGSTVPVVGPVTTSPAGAPVTTRPPVIRPPAGTPPTTVAPAPPSTTSTTSATTTTLRPRPPSLQVDAARTFAVGCANPPIVATTSPGVAAVRLSGIPGGTLDFVPTSATTWSLDWEPLTLGQWPVVYEAASSGGSTRAAGTIVSVPCIR